LLPTQLNALKLANSRGYTQHHDFDTLNTVSSAKCRRIETIVKFSNRFFYSLLITQFLLVGDTYYCKYEQWSTRNDSTYPKEETHCLLMD